MFDLLGEAKCFSKLDLKTGFHQIRVRPNDVDKTAFNKKYGQYEYLVMPIRLCNAPATFQSLMNRIFYDCIDMFLVVSMDDLLEVSHIQHLETVLKRLSEHELYASPKKCELMKDEIEFLGLIIGRNGIKVNPKKAEILRTWPNPKRLTEIRAFIGLLQFFCRFIKNFSALADALINPTKKDQGIDKWDCGCDSAFESLKNYRSACAYFNCTKLEERIPWSYRCISNCSRWYVNPTRRRRKGISYSLFLEEVQFS